MEYLTAKPALSREKVLGLAPSVGAVEPDRDVSSRYLFIPTIDIVDGLTDVGWYPVSAGEQKPRKEERIGKTKHMIRFQRNGTSLKKGEAVLDLVLINSHDRTTAFQLIGGLFRVVCSNGLIIGNKCFHHSIKHVGSATTDAVEASYRIADQLPAVGNQIETWNDIELTPDEAGVYGMAVENLVYGDEGAPFEINRLLHPRRNADNKPTLWNTYNNVQENLMKGGTTYAKRGKNGRLKRNRTRPIKSIDRDIRINKALWTLTEEMAKLKGAAA